jgi:hypothetical protein
MAAATSAINAGLRIFRVPFDFRWSEVGFPSFTFLIMA